MSSPGLSAADDLKRLPQDYDEFHKNLNKMVSHAQNVDSKSISRMMYIAVVSSIIIEHHQVCMHSTDWVMFTHSECVKIWDYMCLF